MSIAHAVVSRQLQFVAGPERSRFYACEAHRGQLMSGEFNLHFVVAKWPMRDEDPDDEIDCDVCRGEDGP